MLANKEARMQPCLTLRFAKVGYFYFVFSLHKLFGCAIWCQLYISAYDFYLDELNGIHYRAKTNPESY